MRLSPAMLAVILLSSSALSREVYVYNFDDYGQFCDPAVGDSLTSGYWVEQTLLALGDDVDSGTTLPSELGGYDAVFVLLGWYRC